MSQGEIIARCREVAEKAYSDYFNPQREKRGQPFTSHLADAFAREFEPLVEAAKKSNEALIERRIGEHEMCRCKFCGILGHNDVLGHFYGIKHRDDCQYVTTYTELVKWSRK